MSLDRIGRQVAEIVFDRIAVGPAFVEVEDVQPLHVTQAFLRGTGTYVLDVEHGEPNFPPMQRRFVVTVREAKR